MSEVGAAFAVSPMDTTAIAATEAMNTPAKAKEKIFTFFLLPRVVIMIGYSPLL